MIISEVNVLFVGPGFHDSQKLTDRMQRWGFRCHFAKNLRTAREIVKTIKVDLVLSKVNLPDGSGYSLVAGLYGLPLSAYLCLPVEDSCFWIPAIEAGKDCLGTPALRPSEFVMTLEKMIQYSPPKSQVN
jgi:PleD family two-component response regulator